MIKILKNKKGAELSINFLIIAALALISLIVIALFFLGGMEKIFGQKKDVTELTNEMKALARATCEFRCRTSDRSGYDNPNFPDAMKTAGYNKCSDLEGMGSFDDACVKKGCKGTATKCEDMGTNCARQGGCSLSGAECKGTPTSCTTFSNSVTCAAQVGCSWG